MKQIIQSRVRNLFILLFILSWVTVQCGDSNPADPGGQEQAPQVPPASTFVMDLTSITEQDPVLLSTQNFLWASTNLVVWNTVVVVSMAIPVASFLEAANHDAERQDDGSWVWSYNFTVLEQDYHARLVARYKQAGIEWEMFITKDGVYDNFKWYTGTCNYALSSGTWELNVEPGNPTPLIDIEWNLDLGESTGDLLYTYVVPASPDSGDYIYGEITDQIPFDALYDVYNRADDNLIEIEWNLTTIEGRVKDPFHFGDENWHCWDTELQDIDCP